MPTWITRGDAADYFSKVTLVQFKMPPTANDIEQLKNVDSLDCVIVLESTPMSTIDRLRDALPGCDIVTTDSPNIDCHVDEGPK